MRAPYRNFDAVCARKSGSCACVISTPKEEGNEKIGKVWCGGGEIQDLPLPANQNVRFDTRTINFEKFSIVKVMKKIANVNGKSA